MAILSRKNIRKTPRNSAFATKKAGRQWDKSSLSKPDRMSFGHLVKQIIDGSREEVSKALTRLKNRPGVLLEIAKYAKQRHTRLGSVALLGDDLEALIELAKHAPKRDTRERALKLLSKHKGAVLLVAAGSHFSDTRLRAVFMLKGKPHLLVRITTDSEFKDVRSAAIGFLIGKTSYLIRVAIESKYPNTRKQVLRSLGRDISALRTIAEESKYGDTKIGAMKILSNMVEDLDNPEVLMDIAKKSPFAECRYLAVSNLASDYKALVEIYEQSQFKNTKTTAMMLLSDATDVIDDPELLAAVAKFSPYEEDRYMAIEKLEKDTDHLTRVANESKFKTTRMAAMGIISSDPDSLREITVASRYKDTRTAAHKKLSDEEIFQDELKRMLDSHSDHRRRDY